jgi:hypothetical protein
LDSQMGYNRPEFQGSQMVPAIRKLIQSLLSPPDSRASALYTIAAETISPVVPVAGNLYQRGPIMRTRGRSPASPSSTVPFLTFPGTYRPFFKKNNS